jgi:hypothetical protein
MVGGERPVGENAGKRRRPEPRRPTGILESVEFIASISRIG